MTNYIYNTICLNFYIDRKSEQELRKECKNIKKISKITKTLVLLLTVSLITTSVSPVYAGWRSSKTAKKNGHTLGAYANLPYWSDRDGGGDWKTRESYGKKVKLTNSWEFYTIGGSCSWKGAVVSGSGSNAGSSYTSKSKTKTVDANGYVYGTGLCLYLGLISTASFSSGNTYYSISTKI